jgi:hypothetical protein
LSHRPTDAKKVARLRKLLRRELPRYIDLVQWLKDRGYASTTGQAKAMMLDRRVKADSHVVGISTYYDPLYGGDVPYAERYIRADLRDSLRVVA